jgi:hypothetical protein
MADERFKILAMKAARDGLLNIVGDGGLLLEDHAGNNVVDAIAKHLNVTKGKRILVDFDGAGGDDLARKLRDNYKLAAREAARFALERGWNNLGGPKSMVGLPLKGSIEPDVQFDSTPEGLKIRKVTSGFRGGPLLLSSDGSQVESAERRLVNIDLVGILCHVKQETPDDQVYGVVTVIGPSNETIVSRKFPDDAGGCLNMGKDGARIANLSIPIIAAQPLQNYSIRVNLIEHDSGDVDQLAKEIASKLKDGAEAVIGGLTGVPAESTADSGEFEDGLAQALGFVFDKILGMGDDPYGPGAIRLGWDELYELATDPAQKPPLTHPHDPKTIDNWTHSVIVDGTDDGGDHGRYEVAFKVWTEIVLMPISAPV